MPLLQIARLRLALGLSASLLALPAMGQTTQTEVPDTDGNGTWSMEELKAVYPDLTAETFASLDVSADGQLDRAELDAALAADALK